MHGVGGATARIVSPDEPHAKRSSLVMAKVTKNLPHTTCTPFILEAETADVNVIPQGRCSSTSEGTILCACGFGSPLMPLDMMSQDISGLKRYSRWCFQLAPDTPFPLPTALLLCLSPLANITP